MNSWPLGVNVMVNFSIADKASVVSLISISGKELSNRFDTVMRFEAQRIEK